ncbi:MAG: BMP family ABC transporter substrate-binding protein [Actinobacteria bacterium]|nr:BMP family ABC transporter substrate-binding protein [Actinomycetota bacterium]
MKRVGLLSLLLVLVFPTLSLPTQAATLNLIGIAYDIGGRGDSGFNDAAGSGVDRAIKELGAKFESTVTLGTQGDRETRLLSLIEKSANPIIAIGGDYAPAVETLSDRFPNTQFILVDDASVAHLNVTSIIFAETQGGYLAGAAAALASKSGKVAMIVNEKQSKLFWNGFNVGVRNSKKAVKASIAFANKNYAATAKDLIESGVDVIYLGVRGSSTDVLDEITKLNLAKNRKKGMPMAYLISVTPDQFLRVTPQSKEFLLARIEKRVDTAVFNLASAAVNGSQYLDIIDQSAGIYGHIFGISDDGITIDIRSKLLDPFSKQIAQAKKQALKVKD